MRSSSIVRSAIARRPGSLPARRLRACGAALALAAAVWAGPARPQEDGPPGPREERTVSVGGVERAYLVHVPPNVAQPAPVVFVFHGGGGRPEAMERKTGIDELADQNGFIAVYPEGLAGPSGRGGTWNVGPPGPPSSAEDVAFVRAILRNLEQAGPIDHARIYAAGHSMGGIFSYRLACEMSDTFAAIAAVSATMVEPSCHPTSPVAVLHIHGTDDERIPIAGGRGAMTAGDRSWPAPERGVAAWRQFDGCTGEPTRSADGGESCTTYGACRATVEYCVIPGGRHPWPDEAAAQIWAFFAAHPKTAN